MFGLANRSVVAAIERLPGAELCKGYTPTTFDESVVLGNAELEKGNAELEKGSVQLEKGNAESPSKPSIPQGDGQTDESDFDMEDEFDDDDDDDEAEAVEDLDDDDSPSLSDSILVESDAESEAPRRSRSKRPAKQRSTPKHSTKLRVRCRITPEGVEAEDTLM